MGKEAAEAGAEGAAGAAAEETRQFNLQWDANAPYRTAGANALANMSLLTGAPDPRATADIQAARERMSYIDRRIAQLEKQGQSSGNIFNAYTSEEINDLLQEKSNLSVTLTRDTQPSWNTPEGGGPGATTVDSLVKADPSYAFRFKEGEDATKNWLSASNQRLSGSALKGLTDYGQDFASTEYGNVFNRNALIAGYGPGANTAPQSDAARYQYMGGQAAGDKYSAYNNAIQGGLQNYLTYSTQNNWTNAMNNRNMSNDVSNMVDYSGLY